MARRHTMTLANLEGRTFGPHPMRVCKEKVDEFLQSTGGDEDRWSGFAPPGYLAFALFVVAPELLATLDGYSIIHGEQTFKWVRALELEKDLWVSGNVSRIRERGASYFVSFEMTVADGDDELAAGTSLFLVTESSPGPAGGAASPSVGLDDRGNPGQEQKSASRADLVRYAAATRDWNPIHWDHGAATAAGLDGVVVHGLLQAAWALDRAAADIGGNLPFESARIRFQNPLYPGSPVTLASTGADGRISVVVTAGEIQHLAAQIVPSRQ